MNNIKSLRTSIGGGLVLWGMLACYLAILLSLYMSGNSVISVMDTTGWVFYVASCISHAATLTLIPFLVLYLPLALARHPKSGGALMAFATGIIATLIFIDMQVYRIYKFHINGFILNMFFGEGASEVFTFSGWLYLKEGLIMAIFPAGALALWWIASRWQDMLHSMVRISVCIAIVCTLYVHLYHIYASFYQIPSVVKSAKLLPYYFPTTAYTFMTNLGAVPPVTIDMDNQQGRGDDVVYPLHPIRAKSPEKKLNIVMILIDSWSRRTLTEECMPNAWRMAQQSQYYTNHFSCSNGTRSGVFGLFFSVPSYYWDAFESSHLSPVLIDWLLKEGYSCQVYPGATLKDPPFFRVIFQHIPHLHITTAGKTVYQRDRQLTNDFISDLKQNAANGTPFFSLLFYDLAHSFELSSDLNQQFTPAWSYADYAALDNSIDPTPFFNLYRNCCWQIDGMLADVFSALEHEGVAENTVVLLTGDHAQEFNENKKNYWGHNGNFSQWQIGVPLVYHCPGNEPGRMDHRTTHYDIVPTLMTDVLGIENPYADYSMGHHLTDRHPRDWHIVGSELNFAYIVEGDTILEKTAYGGLEVTDANLNPVSHYHLDVKKFRQAVNRLNSFYRK